MKALGLLLLRSGFSFLVAVWAAARLMSPEGGIPLIAVWLPEVQPDALSIQLLGGLGALLALLVLTGFFRLAAYPLLGLGFVAAALAVWPFPEAPLDLVTSGVNLFLLHSVLVLAAFAPLAFYGDDRFALDRLFVRRAPAAVAVATAAEDVPSTEKVAAEVAATAAPSEPAADPEPAPEAAEVPAEQQAEAAADEPAAEEAVACEVPAPAPEPAAAESAEPEKTAA